MKTNVRICSTEVFLALNLRGTIFLSKASLKQRFSVTVQGTSCFVFMTVCLILPCSENQLDALWK